MKRSDETQEAMVYQYGLVVSDAAAQGVMDELRRCNRFWNTLVEIEHDCRARYREIAKTDPVVAKLEAAMEVERENLVVANAARKAIRKAARKRIPTPDEDATIEAAREAVRSLGVELRVARKAARESLAEPLAALETERRERVKAARQQSALYWGNYNAVAQSYDTARSRAMRDGSELRFHSFDGGGRLTCQIQGGMSVADLFLGASSQVGIEPVDPRAFTARSRGERRRLARTQLRFLAFTYTDEAGKRCRHYLECGLILHRQIPEDMRIKQAVVARRRIGNQVRWSLSLTCTRPEIARSLRHIGPRASINFGWRKTPRGLRVAMVVDEHGKETEVLLPNVMIERLERVEALRQSRDEAVNELWGTIKPVLRGIRDDAPAALGERLDRLLQAPRVGTRALATLRALWHRECPQFEGGAIALLDRWHGGRHGDKSRWNEASNLSEKIRRRRLDIFRNTALDLAHRYSEIVMGDTNFHQLARRGETGEDLPQEARHMRTLAAPGELRQWLVLQAAKTGTSIKTVPSKDATLVCHACGYRHDQEETSRNRGEALVWQCGHCGAHYDQDVNHAKNLLAA